VTPTFVMAVPWEEQRRLRAQALALATDAEIVWDEHHQAFQTWRKVMETIGEQAAIVLEDDVTLVEGWRDKIEVVVADHPESLIQFFTLGDRAESGWESGSTFMMNQCYYLPKGMASALLEYSDTWTPERHKSGSGWDYDYLMADWLADNRMRYWRSLPSLVQHEAWTSAIDPRRRRNRQAPNLG
jgi:hypothetical protein